MTASIDQALVIQFSDQVHLEASQMTSRLRGKVEQERVRGEKFTKELLGDLESVEVFTRHQKTEGQDISHSRRGAKLREFRTTLYLDKYDELATIIDPAKGYAKKVASSLQKRYDRLCLEAAIGSVLSGKDLTSTTTFSGGGGVTVAAAGVGLTYNKLLEIQQNFINAEVGNDMPVEIYMAISGQQHTNLMQEEELTSGDFSREYVIDKGRIVKAAGINLVMFGSGTNVLNPMLKKIGSDRECIAWASNGICMGIASEIQVRMDERSDMNYTKQIQASLFANALRTEEVLVQRVLCTEV